MKTISLSLIALVLVALPSISAGDAIAVAVAAAKPTIEARPGDAPALAPPSTDEQSPLVASRSCMAPTITEAEPPLAVDDDWTCYGCWACSTGLCCLQGTGWTCVSSCTNECNPPVFPEG